MRMIKLALVLLGVSFGANSYAQDLNNEVLSDDAEILLFNEGDQPLDAVEVEAFSEAEGPDTARLRINCRSRNFRMNRCRVPGRIQSVRLVRRMSFAPCIAGRTFGATRQYVWVSRGCSGQFVVQYRRGGGWWGEGQEQQ